MKILIIYLLTISALFGAIGEITALQGEAQLERETAFLEVERGTPINIADRLETKKRSRVQVILNDDTVITIGPQSSYIFEAYQDKGSPKVMMQLQHGFFKIVTGKIGKIAPERFKVKTKASTIGIRGTQFMATVQDDSESIACSKGSLVVETKQRTFELPSGMMLIYKDHSWSMHELDMERFSPLMPQESSNKTPLESKSNFLPDFSESYTPLEQQIDKPHEHEEYNQF